MHFEGEFRVPGKPDDVIRRFADVPRMAGCMPGAVLQPQAEDGSWPGAMVVSFGPKKISFKGRVTCEFDFTARTGALHGRGAADMRAARIGVKVGFALRDDADSAEPATIVKVTSDAELGGVLADFARTGGVAVANVIMQDFARRATDEFSRDAPPPAAISPAASDAPAAAGSAALPATQAEDFPTTQAGVAAEAHAAAAQAGGAAEAAAETRAAATPTLREAPAPAPHAAPPPPPRPAPQPAALSAHGVLWAVIRYKLRQLAAWLGILSKDAR